MSAARPTHDGGTRAAEPVVIGRLVSVNVGRPADIQWAGRTVRTAVWKNPVTGPVMVRGGNIDGDEQADKNGHGGEHRAVFVYQLDSYKYWAEHLGRTDFEHGQFGENFTVEGLGDDEVYIGDHYRIGEALFEVTQPRVTCFRVGIRMNEPDMPSLLVAHHRPGFYLRVLTEGADPAAHVHLNYPNAGHADLGPSYLPIPLKSDDHRTQVSFGGTVAGNESAREHDWAAMLRFIKSN